jgi:hypothetical protein
VRTANKEKNTEDGVQTSSVQLHYFLQGTSRIEGGRAKFVPLCS